MFALAFELKLAKKMQQDRSNPNLKSAYGLSQRFFAFFGDLLFVLGHFSLFYKNGCPSREIHFGGNLATYLSWPYLLACRHAAFVWLDN